MNHEKQIFEASLEYLYGNDVTSAFPWEQLIYIKSKSTKRLRLIKYRESMFTSVKENGIVTLSIESAKNMMQTSRFLGSCVKVTEDIDEFISKGGNLFCKHVKSVGKNIQVGLDVGILNAKNELIAVGKAVVPKGYMLSFKKGIAVKVRRGTH
jgi:uncharacterized protein with predicted RNA binding PUA domain